MKKPTDKQMLDWADSHAYIYVPMVFPYLDGKNCSGSILKGTPREAIAAAMSADRAGRK